MNAQKRLTLIILGIIVILPFFSTSCFKKGEDDPFVSFHTRKARISATWQFANVDSEIRYAEGTDRDVIVETTSADKSSWSKRIKIEATDSIISLKGRVNPENFIKFDKHGNFESSYTYEYTEDSIINDNEYVRYRTIVSEKSMGTWNFLGKIENDYKNKERIILNYRTKKYETRKNKTEVNTEVEKIPVEELYKLETKDESYTNGEYSDIWVLKKLKNKEIVMEQELNQTLTHAVIVGQIATFYSAKGTRSQTLTR